MSAQPVDLEAVLVKVQKLLSTEGRTPEEAAAYVEKAHALLAAYDLSIESIANLKADPRTSIRHGSEAVATTAGKPDGWKADLLVAVAAAFDCHIVAAYAYEQTARTTRTVVKRHLVGFGHDVEAAHYAHSFLVGEITRLAKAYSRPMWDAIKADAAARGVSVHEAESAWAERRSHPLKAELYFTRGAAEAVAQVLGEDRRQRKQRERAEANANPNAIAVQKESEVRDFIYRERYGMSYDEFQAKTRADSAKWAAAQAAQPEAKRETDAQRRKREAREERQRQRANDRWYRQYIREQRATDHRAVEAGREAGAKISIRRGVPGGAGESRKEIG